MPAELFFHLHRLAIQLYGSSESIARRNRRASRSSRGKLESLRYEPLEFRTLMCADCPEHVAIAPVITSDVPLGPQLPGDSSASAASLSSSGLQAQSTMDMSMGADHVEVTATQIITHAPCPVLVVRPKAA